MFRKLTSPTFGHRHARRNRTLRGVLGRVAFYTIVAWCAVFTVAGFVAPETIDGRGAHELPVVVDLGGGAR